MTEEERNIFKKTLSEASPVPLEAGTLEKMAGFCNLLFEKNKVMNLTAVKTPQAAAILLLPIRSMPLRQVKSPAVFLTSAAAADFPRFPWRRQAGRRLLRSIRRRKS